MLEDILFLLGDSGNGQDDLINLLISHAKAFIASQTQQPYSSDYDFICIKMVLEDFNKLGSEGLASKTFNGISEVYDNASGYSAGLMAQLKSFKPKRIKVL